MKKFMMALVCLMTMVVFSSCGCTYNVTANYEVCYPDGTRSYNETTKVENAYSEPTVVCYSFDGTNYVSVSCSDNPMTNSKKATHYITTTAPIRLNSWSVTECKKEKPRCIAIKKNGEKCNRIAEKNSEYCWKHEDTAHKSKKKGKNDEIYMSDILSH